MLWQWHDSFPCHQGYQPSALTNWAISHPHHSKVEVEVWLKSASQWIHITAPSSLFIYPESCCSFLNHVVLFNIMVHHQAPYREVPIIILPTRHNIARPLHQAPLPTSCFSTIASCSRILRPIAASRLMLQHPTRCCRIHQHVQRSNIILQHPSPCCKNIAHVSAPYSILPMSTLIM